MSDGPGALLRGNVAFRRLTTARVVSFVGDSLSLVVLMLHVAATTGQALAVAALLVGEVVPALLSPLCGAIGDRFDRRRVMTVCELLQAAVTVAVAVARPPLPLLLALVALRATVGRGVFQLASRAAVPSLVGIWRRPTPPSGSAPTGRGDRAAAAARRAGCAARRRRVVRRVGAAAAVSYVGGGLLLDAAGAPVTFLVAGSAGVLATVVVALTLERPAGTVR